MPTDSAHLPPPEPYELELDLNSITAEEIEIVEEIADAAFFDIADALQGIQGPDGRRLRIGKAIKALGFIAQRRDDPTVTVETMRPVSFGGGAKVTGEGPNSPAPSPEVTGGGATSGSK